MQFPHRKGPVQPSLYSRRISRFIDRSFQLQYTRRILFIVIISTLVYALPLFYLVNQNYNYLSKIAYLMAPNLAKHIDGEQVVFNVAIFGVILSQWTLIALFGRRMTEKIIAPLKKLKNHLRLLSRGEYSGPEVRVRITDEFQDLISSYNYYYASLREQSRRDLVKLLKIKEAVRHPETLHTLNEMIEERAEQLNTDPNSIQAKKSTKPDPFQQVS